MEGVFRLSQTLLTSVFGAKDDNWTDRLHYLWTGVLLILMMVLSTSASMFKSGVICYFPAAVDPEVRDFATEYCYISNTYRLKSWAQPEAYKEPSFDNMRGERQVLYYQWVPLLLLVQAFLFYAPRLLWRILKPMSGVDVRGVVQLLTESGDVSKSSELAARKLDRAIDLQRASGRRLGLCGRRNGCFLFPVYMVAKFAYLANAILQFLALNALFTLDDNNRTDFGYALALLRGLVQESVNFWRDGRFFPRIVLCDFKILRLSGWHTHTVMCALPMNVFYEKIYLVLYFWLLFLITISVIDIAFCLARLTCGYVRLTFIERSLLTLDVYDPKTEYNILRSFTDNYLKVDGVFILKIIRQNCGETALLDVLRQLWRTYRLRYQVTYKLLPEGKGGYPDLRADDGAAHNM